MSSRAVASDRPTATAPTECLHERAHIVDSRFYGDFYSTDASRRIFCDVCRYQRWLDVEAALALSQAELGLVPSEQAELIAAAARVELLDLDWVGEEIRRTRHSLVGLLRGLEQACEGGAGEFIHYGATTQDIQDTGQALEMRDVVHEAERQLRHIAERLCARARGHARTVMVGRTHSQPALPTTFGFKVAGWVEELLRHLERLEALKPRVLVAQLSGGVGTMAGFGEQGPDLLERFARRLGLGVPRIGWHVARDGVAEFVATLAMITATLARMADDMRTLARPELGELEQGWRPGRVGSSTMPHKRNPEDCEQVVVLSRLAAAQVELALTAMVGEHERDGRALRLEWAAVADVSHHALAALAIAREIVEGYAPDVERMGANARELSDAIGSEALMLALAEHIGKQSAHALVYELSQTASGQGADLQERAGGDPLVRRHFTTEEIEDIFDPVRSLGTAARAAVQTAERAEAWLASHGGDPVRDAG